MKRLFTPRRLLIGVFGLLVVIQLIPVWLWQTNPTPQSQPKWDSPQTQALTQRACFDCHSDQTIWPWYSYVAPASWLITRDVIAGRRALNFDNWQASLLAPVLAAGIAALLIGGVVLLLTRSTGTLTHWLLRAHRLLARTLHWPNDATWVDHTVAELTRVRALVAERRRMLGLLVLIQLTALSGHSLGLYIILRSLGTSTSYLTVLSAFGIALLTSTVNVLPGGGGTVEAALVAVLTQLGVGAEAVPAAILFRLLNFWMLLPIAAACYSWLMRDRPSR